MLEMICVLLLQFLGRYHCGRVFTGVISFNNHFKACLVFIAELFLSTFGQKLFSVTKSESQYLHFGKLISNIPRLFYAFQSSLSLLDLFLLCFFLFLLFIEFSVSFISVCACLSCAVTADVSVCAVLEDVFFILTAKIQNGILISRFFFKEPLGKAYRTMNLQANSTTKMN